MYNLLGMYQLCKKLKALKNPLRTLSRSLYRSIHTRVFAAKDRILDIQLQLLNCPSDNLA